ncbi:WhiB family transcriptional regulator [Rhodococcus sp. T2V]|uniref:WhiB family transcriptional regulator n=1 Tax=Rhodococcus sp. T2V TaxID=3034164 RepID=UPI0023E1ED93|nr:WhiB family transcriptional regulator [Rhodococcus sp. T2V]MDF3305608.1 WhiB family transcriptional regulator [Rhodococcus sp. T2V]
MNKPTSPEALAETVSDLDRLSIPVDASISDAKRQLERHCLTVGRARVSLAQRARQARDGITPRKPKAQAKPIGPHSLPRVGPLVADLVDGRLIDAACVGHHLLFEERHDHEREPARDARHREAVAICRRCNVLDACRVVADELGDQAAGVWAGEVRSDGSKPKQSKVTA